MTEEKKEKTQADVDAISGADLDTVILRKIIARDNRYELGAYKFVYEALAFTQGMLGKDAPGSPMEKRHVTGQELLEGIRRLAAKEFGPLAPTVFRTWGVQQTRDFGEIVFSLVDAALMGKTDSDTLADFTDGFDFDEAFAEPTEPE